MSDLPLTIGALARICQGEHVQEPLVLQLLGLKAITGSSGEVRYRLMLNDGEFLHDVGILAVDTGLYPLVNEGKISQYTVVKVKKYDCKQTKDGKLCMIVLLDLEVLQDGKEVANMIGNPVTIGKDGKLPQGDIFL